MKRASEKKLNETEIENDLFVFRSAHDADVNTQMVFFRFTQLAVQKSESRPALAFGAKIFKHYGLFSPRKSNLSKAEIYLNYRK